jgi:hypothetical protein
MEGIIWNFGHINVWLMVVQIYCCANVHVDITTQINSWFAAHKTSTSQLLFEVVKIDYIQHHALSDTILQLLQFVKAEIKSSYVNLKTIQDVKVTSALDCCRLTLLHFVDNIAMLCLFSTFTLVILLSNTNTLHFGFFFAGISEILLVIGFLKDDHIRLLLKFISWIEPTSLSIVFS